MRAILPLTQTGEKDKGEIVLRVLERIGVHGDSVRTSIGLWQDVVGSNHHAVLCSRDTALHTYIPVVLYGNV